MSELDPNQLRQPTELEHPTLVQVFNTAHLYSAEGFPFFAQKPDDYCYVGGLKLAPYDRDDSPSRQASGQPYDVTGLEQLRSHYGGSIKLLEAIRRSYSEHITGGEELDGKGIVDVYYMGIKLSMYLLWRADNPIRNGEIPGEVAVLRQALTGIGSVLLNRVKEEELPNLSGHDIARIGEEKGDLVGQRLAVNKEMPERVCPASPDMIAGMSNALLKGNPKREVSPLMEELDIDIVKLYSFVQIGREHTRYDKRLADGYERLLKEDPRRMSPLTKALVGDKTKVQRFDDLVTSYARAMNELQPELYAVLGRTDEPPEMDFMSVMTLRTELLQCRLQVLSSDPDNLTEQAVKEMESLMQEIEKSRK